MPNIGQDNIVNKEIYKYQTGKILCHFTDIKKEAQNENQDNIVFAYSNKFDIVAPFENIYIPIKQIIR